MKRIAVATLCLISISAIAQQAKPSDTEIDARIQALQSQRNEAEDRLVFMAGKLADLQKQLAAAEKSSAACTKAKK